LRSSSGTVMGESAMNAFRMKLSSPPVATGYCLGCKVEL
jgi:hypothetical protein